MSLSEKIVEAVFARTSLAVVAFMVAGGCAVCLFAPDSLIQNLGVLELTTGRRTWVGGFFLLSSLFLVASVASWAFSATCQRQATAKAHAERVTRLRHLSNGERDLLHNLVGRGQRAESYMADFGPANSLQNAGILQLSEAMVALVKQREFSRSTMLTYCIADWAWDYLMSNKELLGANANRT